MTSRRRAPSPLEARNARHWAMLLFLVSMWGSNFALIKIATHTIPPDWVATLRMILGALVVTGAMALRGEKLPRDARAWLWFAWFGILGTAIPYQLITWATAQIDSGLAGIMMAGVPLFTIALAPFFVPDERLSAAKAAGFLAGFAGVAVLIGPSALSHVEGSGLRLTAQSAILCAAVFFALFNVTGRLAPPMSALTRSAGALIMAAIASAVFALVRDPAGLADAGVRSMATVAFLGIVSTGVMTVTLFRLIVDAGASFTSMASYLTPMLAAGVGIVFMGESLSLSAFIGLALVLAGLWLAERLGR